MARIRTVKPTLFRHVEMFDAERETGLPLRLAFIGLFTAADREGRFKWSPRDLKLDCLPYDDVDFSRVLDALSTRGWVVKYTVDGVDYGYIPTWKKHQVINNRETASVLPKPNENNTLTRAARVDDASTLALCNAQVEGKGKEGKGKEEDAVPPARVESDEEIELFRRGKKVLGANAGGLIANLLKAQAGKIPLARAAIETASTKQDPREYIGAIIRGRTPDESRVDGRI